MTDQTGQDTATATVKPTAKPARKARASVKPVTANGMAALLSKRFGGIVTAKSVRQWCRDNVTTYQDERYTPHEYDAKMQQRIVAAWTAKSARRTASKSGGK